MGRVPALIAAHLLQAIGIVLAGAVRRARGGIVAAICSGHVRRHHRAGGVAGATIARATPRASRAGDGGVRHRPDHRTARGGLACCPATGATTRR